MQCSFNYAVSNVSTSKDLLKLERPFPKVLKDIDNSSTTGHYYKHIPYINTPGFQSSSGVFEVRF